MTIVQLDIPSNCAILPQSCTALQDSWCTCCSRTSSLHHCCQTCLQDTQSSHFDPQSPESVLLDKAGSLYGETPCSGQPHNPGSRYSKPQQWHHVCPYHWDTWSSLMPHCQRQHRCHAYHWDMMCSSYWCDSWRSGTVRSGRSHRCDRLCYCPTQ